jgi:hypothetical protein
LASIYGDIERDLGEYSNRGCTSEELCSNLNAFRLFACSKPSNSSNNLAPKFSNLAHEALESVITAAELRNKNRSNMSDVAKWQNFVHDLKVRVLSWNKGVHVCEIVGNCVRKYDAIVTMSVGP